MTTLLTSDAGRRALSTPITRSALRTLTTESRTEPTTSWPTGQAPTTKIVAASRRKAKTKKDATITLGYDSAKEHSNASWSSSHARKANGELMTPKEQFAEFQRIQKATRRLGSKVEKRYTPTGLVTNPPAPQDVTLELLMAAQTHLGHNTSIWNPSNARYIYGVRQGVHIISLETTAAHLRRASRVVEEVAYRGGVILFVGTRNGQMEIVTKAAEMAGGCHLFTKWTPGAITNRDIILRDQQTKVVNQLDEELPDFDKYKGDARPIVPDLVVCLNPLENYTMLYECGLANVPTIGVVDTNTDPSWVTYTIPANDDSLRSVGIIAGVLGNAGRAGQKRRLEDASKGTVAWMTTPTLVRHMVKEQGLARTKRKEVMGRMQANIKGFSDEEQAILNARNDVVEQEPTVSDAELLELLGAAAGSGSSAEVAEIESRIKDGANIVADIEVALKQAGSHGGKIAEVEGQLKRASEMASEVEAALKRN